MVKSNEEIKIGFIRYWNGNLKLILSILAIFLIVGGAFASWYDHKNSLDKLDMKVVNIDKKLDTCNEEQREDMATARIDGCDPAKKHVTQIAVLETELANIKTAQTVNTAAIIKAIEER